MNKTYLESQTGKAFPLLSSMVIGRAPGCDLCIPDASASRLHALIYTLPDLGYWIADLGSTNGVKVNGVRITGPRQLGDGDSLELGNYVFTYRAGAGIGSRRKNRPSTPTIRHNPPAIVSNTVVLLLAQDGQIENISDAGKKLLRIYLPTVAKGNLAVTVLNWIKDHGDKLAPAVLAKHNRSQLMIRLVEDSGVRRVVILWEVQLLDGAQLTARLNLTEREGDILFWVVEGKNNPQIAKILAISSRTVESHLASIYRKIGVENRHGALRLVMSLIDSASH